MHTNPQLTWGGANHDISHYKENIVSTNFPIGYTELELIMSHVDGNRYFIRGHLIDNMGCRSTEGNFTVNGM